MTMKLKNVFILFAGALLILNPFIGGAYAVETSVFDSIKLTDADNNEKTGFMAGEEIYITILFDAKKYEKDAAYQFALW